MVKYLVLSCLFLVVGFSPPDLQAATGDRLWTGSIGGNQATWSTPVLFGSLVIVKGQDGGLTALRATDGVQAWYNETVAASISSPILWEGNLYLGANAHVYKIAPATGSILVDRTVDGWISNHAPAALGDLLFFVTALDSVYTLHAASTATLSDVWTQPLPAAASVLTDGTNLYVLGDTLAALNPLTGESIWAVSPPEGFTAFQEGALDDGYLVAFVINTSGSPYASALTCWSIGNGAALPGLVWNQGFGAAMVDGSPPVIDGGRVFASSRDGVLQAFTLATGAALWTYPVRNEGVAPALPVAVDGLVYIQVFIGPPVMTCLDGATGAPVWATMGCAGISWSQPAVGSGAVYLASDWSGVYAFATGTRSHIWPMYKNNAAQTSSSVTRAQTMSAGVDLLLLLQ